MVERIKKARLIYNPTSGQEIIKKNIAEVLDVLEDVGYETKPFKWILVVPMAASISSTLLQQEP